MKTKIKSTICAIFLGLSLLLPNLALAQTPSTATPTGAPSNALLQRLQNVAGMGGYQTDPNIASTPKIIGTVVGAFLGFLGITFLILMIIAGYGWMTANGNEEAVSKAKQTIKQSIIGLIVAVSAWSLWSFIFQRFILLG